MRKLLFGDTYDVGWSRSLFIIGSKSIRDCSLLLVLMLLASLGWTGDACRAGGTVPLEKIGVCKYTRS